MAPGLKPDASVSAAAGYCRERAAAKPDPEEVAGAEILDPRLV